jgi:hypothetical protein
VDIDGEQVRLTRVQYDILATLMAHPATGTDPSRPTEDPCQDRSTPGRTCVHGSTSHSPAGHARVGSHP